MSPTEFPIWLKEHKSLHPGLEPWMAKFDDKERSEMIGHWARTLSKCSFSAAKEASRRIGEQPKPPYFGEHHFAIKRIASEIDSARHRAAVTGRVGAGSWKCPICRDAGMVTLFCVVAMNNGQRRNLFDASDIVGHVGKYGDNTKRHPNENGSETLIECGGACSCECGEGFRNVPRLNDSRLIAEAKCLRTGEWWGKVAERAVF